MSHFTEALYLKRQLQRLINEQTLLKTKLHYLLEAAAPPPQPKGGLSADPSATVIGHVFTPQSTTLSGSNLAGTSELWIRLVFTNLVNLDILCQGASNCIWSNPNVQNAFLEALLDWLEANNINQGQMLSHLSRWEAYTNMINYVNTLSPGAAQTYFAENPQWQSIFNDINNPAFQQALEGYLDNLNQFMDLLNRFREELSSGGPITPDNLWYNFHMQANVIALGQLDNYAKKLEEQIAKFRRFAEEARPGSSGNRFSLNQFNIRMSRFIDALGRAAGLNYTPSQLADYIRAIINGDQDALREILRSNPWIRGMQQQLANLNNVQLTELLQRLDSAQNTAQMYAALAAVLGITVAAFILAYIYNYFSQQTQQSGGYSPTP